MAAEFCAWSWDMGGLEHHMQSITCWKLQPGMGLFHQAHRSHAAALNMRFDRTRTMSHDASARIADHWWHVLYLELAKAVEGRNCNVMLLCFVYAAYTGSRQMQSSRVWARASKSRPADRTHSFKAMPVVPGSPVGPWFRK